MLPCYPGFCASAPQVLFGLLYHIEAQNAHPDTVHTVFKGFYNYLTSKGFDRTSAAVSMRQTIGHHRLAHMALRGPPNFIDRIIFETGRSLMVLETKGKVYTLLLGSFRAIQTSIPPFFFNLDYLNDIILYLILKEFLILRIDESCAQRDYDCMGTSETEKDILIAVLITFCISIALTSIDSFFLRKSFFKTNIWLDMVFGVLSPVLPAIYHFRLSQMRFQLVRQKSKANKDALMKKIRSIGKLSDSVQSTKEIEDGFEAIVQISLLLGLITFNPYTFKAPSGQTYSYFFGVAHLVLRGNLILFFASLFISFLGPCWIYVNRTNILRHGSLNMSRKLVLMARNILFLLVRVFVITSAIFIPSIRRWNVFIQNKAIDASLLLSNWRFNREFQKYFSRGLDTVTAEIRTNCLIFGIFLLIHFTLVTSYGIFFFCLGAQPESIYSGS